MLSSGLRKVMKALLILLAAPLITADANASSEVSTAGLDPRAERIGYWANGRCISVKKTSKAFVSRVNC